MHADLLLIGVHEELTKCMPYGSLLTLLWESKQAVLFARMLCHGRFQELPADNRRRTIEMCLACLEESSEMPGLGPSVLALRDRVDRDLSEDQRKRLEALVQRLYPDPRCR